MSSYDAGVTLVGNVTTDPEIKHTDTGKTLAIFNIATNLRKRDSSGQWVDNGTLYDRCVAWGLVAEAVANNIKKGDPVIILGQYRDNSYDVEARDPQGNPITKRIHAKQLVVERIGHDLRWGTARFERRSVSQGYSGGAGAPAYQGQGPQSGSPAAGWGGGNYPAAGAAQPPQGAYGGASGGHHPSEGFPPKPSAQGFPQGNLQGGYPVSEPLEEEPPF